MWEKIFILRSSEFPQNPSNWHQKYVAILQHIGLPHSTKAFWFNKRNLRRLPSTSGILKTTHESLLRKKKKKQVGEGQITAWSCQIPGTRHPAEALQTWQIFSSQFATKKKRHSILGKTDEWRWFPGQTRSCVRVRGRKKNPHKKSLSPLTLTQGCATKPDNLHSNSNT